MVLHVKSCELKMMKTNITLKLDAELLRDARVLAAEDGRSVSAFLSERLEALVRALARLRKGMVLNWAPARSRDELHER